MMDDHTMIVVILVLQVIAVLLALAPWRWR
jgi:hypothetical protein